MPNDSADSTRLKSDTATDIGEKVLRWFAQIGAAVTKPTKHFLRARYPASDEKRVESTLEEAGAIAAATEIAVLTTTKSFNVPDTAEVKVDTDAQIDSAASTVSDQEENSATTRLGEDVECLTGVQVEDRPEGTARSL